MTEKRYAIQQTDEMNPSLASPVWDDVPRAVLSVHRWKKYTPPPATEAQLLRCPSGFSVRMHTNERALRAECTEQNGKIHEDSCMGFFFMPDPSDGRYLNFELNPLGVLHLGIGENRKGRVHLDTDRSIFCIESQAREGDWTLKFYVPDAFLLSHYQRVARECRGNFYKCGDCTDHPHFGTWCEVETPMPDFHQSAFFGTMAW